VECWLVVECRLVMECRLVVECRLDVECRLVLECRLVMECRLVVECRPAAIRSRDGHRRWPEQCVDHHVVLTRHVANISCKFCHIGQLPTLHGCPPISHLAQCIGKWLMVCVDGKWPAF
jgi:hypothetical protein